jgi:hypothetical protein
MDKEAFHWLCGVICRDGFQQSLGQKSGTDPSCQHNFLSHQQPQEHKNKQESTIFWSSIWIQQTALYGQGSISLALWCHAGMAFSKTWVKNQGWI